MHTLIPIRRPSPRINAPEVLHDFERSQSNTSWRPFGHAWAARLGSLRVVHGPPMMETTMPCMQRVLCVARKWVLVLCFYQEHPVLVDIPRCAHP
jgi:hypothetical protein